MMHRSRTPLLLHARRRREGSVFILVAAILAVLALLTLGLAFTARTETMAARNWGNTVQTREAAVTNTPLYPAPYGGYGNSFGTPLRSTSEAAAGDSAATIAAKESLVPHTIDLNPTQTTGAPASAPSGGIVVQDASSRINLNAVVPIEENSRTAATDISDATHAAPLEGIGQTTLERFIALRLTEAHVTGVDAKKLAGAIATHRWGDDGKPGTSGQNFNDRPVSYGARNADSAQRAESTIHDSSVSLADPRLTPNGDDKPYAAIIELMSLPGMTVDAYRALAPFFTVFNASYAAWQLPGAADSAGRAKGLAQIDPNTASPELIFAALKQRFPSAPEETLGQFAVNMIDRRDADDTPTAFAVGGKTYYGFEMNPVINEVCPDTATPDEDGDSGEFVEIANPYDKSFSLNGWSLRAGNFSIPLSGALPPGGFLVVTDDFDGRSDQNRQIQSGMGSFYDIFHVVPSGDKRRLIEIPELNLDSGGGKVELFNGAGKQVDAFEYGPAVWNGATLSLQRTDPRLRACVVAPATPMASNDGADPKRLSEDALRIQAQWQNKFYGAEIEVMLTPAAYAVADAQHKTTASAPWAMPVLASAAAGQLDVRLIDCFRVGAKPERREAPVAVAGADANDGAAVLPASQVTFGRININTAPLGLLAALPGMTGELLDGVGISRGDIVNARNRGLAASEEAAWLSVDPSVPPRWQNLSDFILDDHVWGMRDLYERLDAVHAFSKSITTHSMSLIVDNDQSSSPDRAGATTGVRPSRLRSERIVTGDRGAAETVDFRLLGAETGNQADPDSHYAQPLSSAKQVLDLEREKGRIETINNAFDKRKTASIK